jgi:hypothetical protein
VERKWVFLNPKKSQNSATCIPEDFLLAQVVVRKSFIEIKGDNQHLLSHPLILMPMIVFTVDKNPAYPMAIEELKKEKKMPVGIQIRQVKYLNNIVEQDHRFIKKRVRSMLGLKSFRTVKSLLSGIEGCISLKKANLLYWTSLSKIK